MDRGPFRVPSSIDKTPVSKPAPEPVPQEPVQVEQPPKEEAPKPVAAAAPVRASLTPPKTKKNISKKLRTRVIATILIIIIAIIAWSVWANTRPTMTAIDSSKFQAVFFANGNVYFGKLKNFDNDYYRMTTVYYPQTQNSGTDTAAQKAATDETSITLLKLSDAIHGPEDEIMIAKDQVLFYQNLRADSKVTKLINSAKQ